jgi:hypothetical protein
MAWLPAGLAANIDRMAAGGGMIAMPALVLSSYLMILLWLAIYTLVKVLQTACRTRG